MDIKIPNQPVSVVLAGCELKFVRDLESGYILVSSSLGEEKLNQLQMNIFIGCLRSLGDLTSQAIRADALKG